MFGILNKYQYCENAQNNRLILFYKVYRLIIEPSKFREKVGMTVLIHPLTHIATLTLHITNFEFASLVSTSLLMLWLLAPCILVTVN